MPRLPGKNICFLILTFFGCWAALKYLLPLAVPFLLGGSIALIAEPGVGKLSEKLPRNVAAALGVTGALLLLTCGVFLLAALLVRELSLLANAVPDLSQTARSGLSALEKFLLNLSDAAPTGLRPLLSRTVTGAFSSGSAIVENLSARLPKMASAVLSWLPGSALTLGTGILSAFMFSSRLPRLKDWFSHRLLNTALFAKIQAAIVGWLKAQLKLTGLCFAIVCSGFLLLGIPYAPIWAMLTALVDAVPILGTGTVLLPWSLVYLLQGQSVRALGLLGVYIVAMVARSVMEPRLVGKQLGLDPLVTLVALYIGFRLWGIGGMLLSPVLCVAAAEAVKVKGEQNRDF